MEYRNLGRTGVKVSPFCLGCMTFGRKADAAESKAIISKALDAGINFFDTANVYGRGSSETTTGQIIADLGVRNRIVLATKVHGAMDDDDPNAQGTSRRHIMEQVEGSLHRLKTDYIDLYQIHRPRPETPVDETLRALDDLVHSGKVRYLGTSTWPAWKLVESVWLAKELGSNRFVCEQPPYHILDRRYERELAPVVEQYGFGVIPWSPLAGGFLTGKYRRGAERPADSRLSSGNVRQGLFSDRSFDVLETIEELAAAKGCTPSQLALAWCAAGPGITAPIVGPRSVEQLEDNLGALNVTITPADFERIDAVSPPGGFIARYYEAAFGANLYR